MKKYKIVFLDEGEQKQETFDAHNIIHLSDIFISKYPNAEVVSVKEVKER